MKTWVSITFLLLVSPLISASASSAATDNLELEQALDKPDAATSKQPPAKSVAQPSRGQLLYENQCIACHDSQVHIRNHSKAGNIEAVRSWVEHWSQQLQLNWTRGEIEDVVFYLNQKYYLYSE